MTPDDFTLECEWMALDIETINGSPDDAERFIVQAYRCESFGTWADATIGKKIKEAWEKKKERLALLDAAPIICVSLQGSFRPPSLVHWLPTAIEAPAGSEMLACSDESAMLVALRIYLDATCAQDTTLVGHNIRDFDLPKLRHAYCRHGLRLPQCLTYRDQPYYDTMEAYCKRFSVHRAIMIGLQDVLDAFGMTHHKADVDGGMVQQMYESGEHQALANYSILDVIAEADLFERMTGQAACLR